MPPIPGESGPCFAVHPEASRHVRRGHQGNARRGKHLGRGGHRIGIGPLVTHNPDHAFGYRNSAWLKRGHGVYYQCTPGTNRASRLTARGVRMPPVTARTGRFGLRFDGRAVTGSEGSPRAAAESG